MMGEGKDLIDNIQDFSKSFTGVITWMWVIAISSWGGMVSYFHKMEKYGIPFSLFKFAMEVATSAFVGVITFLLCDSAGLSWEVTAAMVGVSGHMGTRALFIIEKRYEQMFKGNDDGKNS